MSYHYGMLLLLLACGPADSGKTDDCTKATWYADDDGDGFGDVATSYEECDAPDGAVADATDCDDAHAEALPGGAEVCDDLDNDCDGEADNGAADAIAQFLDADLDGHGTAASPGTACPDTSGYSTAADDCDDARNDVYAGAPEVCDLADNDCNSRIDEGFDLDGDGFPSDAACAVVWGLDADCDDERDSSHPGGVEVCNDASDNDCDGTANDCGFAEAASLGDADASWLAEHSGDLTSGAFGAGDVTGDGASDLLIGAPQVSAGGAVYVVAGNSAGEGELRDAPARLVCASTGAGAGTALYARDLDGDGILDVLVGGPGDEGAGVDAGAAWLVKGPLVDGTDIDAGTKISGQRKGAYAGSTLAIGDLNDDGMDDVVIGAWGQRGDAAAGGMAYVVSGPLTAAVDLNTILVSFQGDSFEDFAGAAVAVGDADGDGLKDMIVGEWGDDTGGGLAGSVAVVSAPSGVAHEFDADVFLVGQGADGIGYSLTTGDFNGDGHVDVVTGAPGSNRTAVDGGLVIVALGPLAATGEFSGFAFTTTDEGAAVGTSVASGDFDHDGVDDLVMGAPGVGSGRAYVFSGPIDAPHDVTEATAALDDPNGSSGAAAQMFADDVDGDAGDDLVVGSPASGSAGAVFVLFGGGN